MFKSKINLIVLDFNKNKLYFKNIIFVAKKMKNIFKP